MGGGGVLGVVCCLVLQAPKGRPWEPDAQPAGGLFGLDTPPLGHRHAASGSTTA